MLLRFVHRRWFMDLLLPLCQHRLLQPFPVLPRTDSLSKVVYWLICCSARVPLSIWRPFQMRRRRASSKRFSPFFRPKRNYLILINNCLSNPHHILNTAWAIDIQNINTQYAGSKITLDIMTTHSDYVNLEFVASKASSILF